MSTRRSRDGDPPSALPARPTNVVCTGWGTGRPFTPGPLGGTAAQLEGRLAAQFGSGNETAAQLDAQYGSGKETAAQLATHFGSGEETAAQLAARLDTQFGSGKETAAQLAAMAKAGRVKGSSSPGSGGPGGQGSRKRKTKWPPGTVMGWCPNCGAEGKKGNKHNQPMQQGVPGPQCGRFSLSAPPAPLP